LQNQTLTELGLSRPARVIAFCPGAEYGPAKRWPAAHFAALAKKLAEQDCAIWLFGSPKDHAVAEEISQLAPGLCRNLCGATSLAQAIDLLAMAELVVCNDSGLMHVAAALERPLVTLYGSSSPGFTPPLSDQADILSLKLHCSPCFKRECPLGHLDCLNKLTPEYVLAAALKRMTA
jgi:heptosyltransferase-2